MVKIKNTDNCLQGCGQLELSYMAGGNVKMLQAVCNFAVSYEVKHTLTICI